jgi:ribosomal-protein-alanine N-acetyltransferase
MPGARQPLLRPLRLNDLIYVMQIEQRAYAFPWTEAIMRDCFKSGYQTTAVESDGLLHGYGWMSCAVGEAHILNIAVDPGMQGRGYGRRILKRLLDIARWYRAETVFLEVRESNETAIKLYESHGFNQVGIRKSYYPAHQGREDALIYAMAMLPPDVI